MADAAEPFRMAGAEEAGGHDRGHVIDHHHQQGDGTDARQGMQQCLHHEAQPWQHRQQAQHPQYTQRAQDRQRSAGGHQGDAHHDKIENVPAAAEEARSLGNELEADLHHEHAENQLVEGEQLGTDVRHDRRRGFHPEDDGVDHDQADDEVLYPL